MDTRPPHGDPAADATSPLHIPGGELPCGASVDELLEQVAGRHANEPTPHQVGCLHCRAALTEFADLWAPVHALATAPVTTPPALVASVIRRITRLLHDVWYTLEPTPDGSIRVAARTVAALARGAALRVPGVRVAFGRSSHGPVATGADTATRRHRYPDAAVGVLGQTAFVELALAVEYGRSIDAIAHEVQRRVVSELRDAVGLQQVNVTINVDDVLR